MRGEACYERTNITCRRAVKRSLPRFQRGDSLTRQTNCTHFHHQLLILGSLMLSHGLIIKAVRKAPSKRIALSPHKVET
jgi:hypothetical protein